MDKTYWEQAWDEARLKSPGKVRPENEESWGKYWNEVAGEYLQDVIAEEQAYRSIVRYLKDQKAFQPGDRVLDVGCGPGTYTLLFAKEASEVDALDPSVPMLEAMMSEASRRKLSGIRPIPAAWEKFSAPDKYDFTFSAMSPAIKDAGTLRKLEACSARSCSLVTYGQSGHSQARNELWELVVGERQATNAFLYTYPYNLLREWGREPALEMFSVEREKESAVDTLVQHYVTYFGIFTRVDERVSRSIREYFENRSEDGRVVEKTRTKLAVITWDLRGNMEG